MSLNNTDNNNDLTKVKRLLSQIVNDMKRSGQELQHLKAIQQDIVTKTMPVEVAYLLGAMMMLSGILFICSNLAALKLLNIGPFPVDGGIIFFPLVYILDDLFKEIYGEKMSYRFIWIGFALNLLVILGFALLALLPDSLFYTENQSFYILTANMQRTFLASAIASMVSRLIENKMFAKFYQKHPDDPMWLRAIKSSLVSRGFDLMIFDLTAFITVVPLRDLAKQLFLAYVMSSVLESLFLPLENYLSDQVKTRFHYLHGEFYH